MVGARRTSQPTRRAFRVLAALALLLMAAGTGARPAAAQASTCVAGQDGHVDQKTALAISGAGCVDIPNGAAGQTIFAWTVSAADAAHRWSLHVTPISGNAVKVAIYKDPQDLTVTPTQIGEIDGAGAGAGVDSEPLIFEPGPYFLGVATSGPGAYAFTLKDEGALPASGDKEPNDSQATATKLKSVFALSGDLNGSDDWYQWKLSKADAAKHWNVVFQVPLGESKSLYLYDGTGTSLTTLGTDSLGTANLAGLGLNAGTYYLLVGQSDHSVPYLLTAVEGDDRSADTEDEPNNTASTANAFDPANTMYGYIANSYDTDYYTFHVDKTLAASLFDLTVMASPGIDRKLCLVDSDGSDTTCKENTTGLVALSGLSLTEGDHLFRVGGDASATDEYSVDLLVTGKVQPGVETLPNDSIATANLLNQSNSVKGKFGSGDGDRHYFLLQTAGDPQLWRIEALGGGISSLRLSDSDGTTLADGVINADGSYGVLQDQFLTPGNHWISVAGANGAFSVTATPTGPPDPNGEREPNNDLANSEILTMGQPKTGRLPDAADVDVYRFSLEATEHVIIKVQSPADGIVSTRIEWYGNDVQQGAPAKSGGLETFDLLLKPGDYSIWLSGATPSEAKYQLSLDRADPFVFAVDQEPNNSFADASPLPPSLTLTGTVGEFGSDYDWYQLPPMARASDLVLNYSSTNVSARIYDAAGNEIPVQVAADYLSGEASIPANTALGIRIQGNAAAYTVGLVFTPGPKPAAAVKSNVAITLTLDPNPVAAYWEAGQKVDGVIKLTTTGLLPQKVDLAAVTSHYAWSLGLSQTSVLVAPGPGVTIPVTLTIQPDAWAGVPVRMTVRALSANGAIATSFVEITPSGDVGPANPAFVWPVPAPLLGGLDVASLALGAKVVPSVDQGKEEQLHDGLSTTGGGFYDSSTTFPLTLTVQLAGLDAAPVAGVILNPLNSEAPSTWARGFKLMLSTDGSTYTEALSGVIQALPIDQSFVLPKPVLAKYAQLVLLSNDDPSGSSPEVSLGEWKVVATPGFTPSTTAIDIADPANGGHIVNMNPQFGDPQTAAAMLTPNSKPTTIDVKAGQKPVIIIGFDEERAAQVSELTWTDPPGSNPDARFTKMTVEVATAGPQGPWTKVGTWTLKRASDGTVSPLTFDKPIWARFIRLTGNGPKTDGTWEYPNQIQVLETPTNATYQSITGQWGYGNPSGPYELANPPAPKTLPPLQANTTKAAAAPLAAKTAASGQVQIGKTVAWYTVTAPGNQNTLSFTVTGDPVADATVQVFDAGGDPVPVKAGPAGSATTAVYVASVKPGASYTVEVTQPSHSIVFAFDTSASMASYEDMVKQALKSFAADVTPGEEFVNIMPFSEDFLLKTWSDQPYQIQTALSQYADTSLSSSSEQTIISATAGLQGRDGAKAILLVTDGETSSYPLMSQMWSSLVNVEPRIFAVHVGSGGDGGVSRHLMQDWAASGEGFYQYTTTQGDMDRAFDRLATWMRRPAGFTFSYQTSEQAAPAPTPAATATPAKPGGLQVTMTAQSSTQPAAQVSTNVAVEIILDTSGSMLQEVEPGKSRIDVARATLVDLVSNKLPAGVPVALRTFADDPGSCDTILRAPLAPLDPGTMASTIENVGVTNLVKTPIGAALDQVATDLAGVRGPKIVVLVTDGEETCGGDPAASIKNLRAQGFDVQVNIVGFALDNDALKAQFQSWAQLGGGSYFDATNSAELNAAVDRALAAPFQVFDAAGKLVAAGQVGGPAVALAPGTYKVVVLTDPQRVFAKAVVMPGKTTTLKLEDGNTS